MELKILLRSYPGMQQLWSVALALALQAAYSDARELAAAETGLAIDTFPLQCPHSGQMKPFSHARTPPMMCAPANTDTFDRNDGGLKPMLPASPAARGPRAASSSG
jgi:hypothetical protein